MRSKKLIGFGLVIVLVVAACSGDGASETFQEIGSSLDGGGGDAATMTTMAASGTEQEQEAGEAEAPEDDKDQLGSGGIVPAALPVDFGRDIIFTADLSVAVTDVAAAGEEATRVISGLGGFLFGQQSSGGANPSSILTFKVAPADFQESLTRLGSIGEVRHQRVSASDVTERIVDLESRIATATASVDRLRGLLLEATDIKAIVELESELLTRETELETLRGSLRTLQDQVALATIVLELTEAASHPSFAAGVTFYNSHDEGLSCPGDVDFSIETGTPATVCYEILNTGDTLLANFDFRDPVLDIETEDLVVVFGSVTEALEPGDSFVVAVEVTPERDLRPRTTVNAVPVDEDGSELARPVSQTETFFVDTVDQEGIASFGDGLAASWDLMVRLGQMLVLAFGALLPFAWVPVVVWLVLRYRRREGAEV